MRPLQEIICLYSKSLKFCTKFKKKKYKMNSKSLLLFSGGIDSTVILYSLIKKNIFPICLSFDYRQRHKRELESAAKITKLCKVIHKIINLDFSFANSSLVNKSEIKEKNSYVPGRNIIFLSIAVSYAESNNISNIYIGANADDSNNFPDCRIKFFKSYQNTINFGIRDKIKIIIPLIKLTKEKVIEKGISLDIPFNLTWSCYAGAEKPCGKCEPCMAMRKYLWKK